MADPVSAAAGIVGLVAFAIQSSKVLYETVQNVKTNSRSVRELKDELNSLNGVLEALKDTVAAAEADFSALQTPLLKCGQLCEQFAILVRKCSQHADSGKFSMRDFLAITYKSKDITELRALIGAYKSTISIALADANIRQVNVTASLLREYKQTIEDTTSDLQELLQKLNEPASGSSTPTNTNTPPIVVDQSDLVGERASIEECLAICAKVWKHIDEVQNEAFPEKVVYTEHGPDVVVTRGTGEASRMTSRRLEDCKVEIGFTASDLRARLQEATRELAKLSRQSEANGRSSTVGTGTVRSDEDRESIKQCLSICQEAAEEVKKERISVYEDVFLADYGDQFVVSTFGDLISAKRVTAGTHARQVLGQLSDESLQQLSKDFGTRRYEDVTVRGASTANGNAKADRLGSQFAGRYGTGQKLS